MALARAQPRSEMRLVENLPEVHELGTDDALQRAITLSEKAAERRTKHEQLGDDDERLRMALEASAYAASGGKPPRAVVASLPSGKRLDIIVDDPPTSQASASH